MLNTQRVSRKWTSPSMKAPSLGMAKWIQRPTKTCHPQTNNQLQALSLHVHAPVALALTLADWPGTHHYLTALRNQLARPLIKRWPRTHCHHAYQPLHLRWHRIRNKSFGWATQRLVSHQLTPLSLLLPLCKHHK